MPETPKITARKKGKPERVKVGFTLERKQALLLQVMAKALGVTQGELLGYLLTRAKEDTRNTLRAIKEMVEKDREEAMKQLEAM